MKFVSRERLYPALTILAALAFFFWCYWTTLAELQYKWAHDPLYSHGYLVPVVSAFVLWLRRHQLDVSQWRIAPWGFLIILGATALRLVGTYYYAMWFDTLSLVVCITGLCALLGGLSALRYAWPSLAFLLYMLPLPYRIEMTLGYPMQRLATIASVYVLQTFGFAAIAEGNVIHFNDTQIGIVEACSGLRMLMVFFAVATCVAFVIRRPLAQKALVLLSAIPIAIITNVARITVTGIVHDQYRNDWLNHVLHDGAGLLMMPVALLLLGLELWVLSRAVVIDYVEPVPVRS